MEKIYVCVCLGTSFRFHKTLGLQNCQNDRKYCFVFRLCAMYAFYHLYVRLSFTVNDCRSDLSPVNISFPIISGEFDALHQLSVKKKILWKYSIQSLKTADVVLLSLFMTDNGICDIPHAA